MHTFTYPKPHFQGLFSHISGARRRWAVWAKEWTMFRLIGWTATIGLISVLIWYMAADVSFASTAIAGVALATIGLLGGLHIGSHSAASYIKDIQRLNKVLADQNAELEKANAILLKELAGEVGPRTRSESA